MNTRLPKKIELLLLSGRVQKIIADKIGLSPTTYYRAKKIIEESPELIKDKVRSGKVTINKAYSQLQKEQKRKQFLLLANSESKISFPEGVKLILGDFVEYSKDIPAILLTLSLQTHRMEKNTYTFTKACLK